MGAGISRAIAKETGTYRELLSRTLRKPMVLAAEIQCLS
jgi:hypothetical protein